MERSVRRFVLQVDLGAFGEKELNDGLHSIGSCEVKSCLAHSVLLEVDINALIETFLEAIKISSSGRV